MLTQFFRSINWVDVVLLVLFVRTVFISVKTGLIAEVFRLLGLVTALFVGLHHYAFAAEFLAKKTFLPLADLRFLVFTILVCAVILVFKFARDGILLLFKVKTNHQGFDKYGAGVLGAVRGWLLCSTVLFAVFLVSHPLVHAQAFSSWGHKVAARAAPDTYSFLFHQVIGKLFEGQKFNADVFTVVSGQSKM
ncbi:MAG: CvpA family protein [Candidatus Omnitrophica bacterium]|nr:CvpA family protein [Candidatus Omnitrophota bacterium]